MSRSDSRYLRRALRTVAAAELVPNRMRPLLLRRAGVKIPADVTIFGGSTFSGEGQVRIGAGSFLNHQCYFDCGADIDLGAGVGLGPRVQLLTSTHEIGTPELRTGARRTLGITIGGGSWIGAGVIVLAGVHIGAGCVIAAGSVVLSDTAPNSLYAGVPARLVRALEEGESRRSVNSAPRLRTAT